MKNKIRLLREQLGITQVEFGKRIGVSRQAVIAIEKGRYEPSIWMAYDIARVFGLPIEVVFDFESSERRSRSQMSREAVYGGAQHTKV